MSDVSDPRLRDEDHAWIVHSEPLEARTASIDQGKIDGRFPSDHYPNIAELHWP